MNCGVYSIVSPSGNMYIGSSKNIKKRWVEHRVKLNKGTHHSPPLQNSWNKYNKELKFNLLLVCTPQNLLAYEQQYIDFYKPSYNIAKFAGSRLGHVPTIETRGKISSALKGVPKGPRSPISVEARQKISLSLLGNKRATANKGYVKTEEHRRNLSLSGLGHVVSEETRRKIGKASKRAWELKKSNAV